MIAKKNRVLKKEEFNRVFRIGKSFFADPVSLRLAPSEKDIFRLGISVGLKFSKKATQRNRLKRQIRAIFSAKMGKIAPGGFDVVVMVSPKTSEEIKTADLEKAIEIVLKKANLL